MYTKGPRKDNQPLDNLSKLQTKKGNGKTKKYIGKWCDFHKRPWHNTDECHKRKPLVVELKSLELDPKFYSDSKMDKGKKIIDAEPSATISTSQIQPEDPEKPKEG